MAAIAAMTDTVENLILDLVERLGRNERTYQGPRSGVVLQAMSLNIRLQRSVRDNVLSVEGSVLAR